MSYYCLVALWLLAAFEGQAMQVVGRFTEDRAVGASGGGVATAGPYTLTDTVGQPSVGSASSADYALDDGFWNVDRANRPPVAQTLTLTRKPSVPVRIRLSDLSTNWSDPDGDSIVFVSAAAASTNGVPIYANATFILYEVGTNQTQNVTDAFTYTIRDQPPEGISALTAIGTVIIQVETGTNSSFNIISAGLAPDGNSRLTFGGIPGQSYLIQRTLSLDAPVVWTTLTNNVDGTTTFVAGPTGQWTHTDLNATNYPTRYYRSAVP